MRGLVSFMQMAGHVSLRHLLQQRNPDVCKLPNAVQDVRRFGFEVVCDRLGRIILKLYVDVPVLLAAVGRWRAPQAQLHDPVDGYLVARQSKMALKSNPAPGGGDPIADGAFFKPNSRGGMKESERTRRRRAALDPPCVFVDNSGIWLVDELGLGVFGCLGGIINTYKRFL